ncbi:unnamed protein product, partial [Prorocentrum cordatum]
MVAWARAELGAEPCAGEEGDSVPSSPSPFPLPLAAERAREVRPANRGAARRRARRERAETLVVDAVASLNALADSRAGQGVQLALPRHVPGHELSDCQRSMLGNIARMVKLFDPPIPNSSLEGGALAELVRSSSIYDVEDTSTSARYAPSMLKVLEGRTRPIDARELVGDYAREYLDNPNSKIALDAVARAAAAEPIQPRWDPSLRQPGPRRRDLIRRLDAVGLIAYRRRRLGRVGMFFVEKKDKDAIRLVLDAPDQRVVGHIVDHFSTRRELLSTLQHLRPPFIGDGRGGRGGFDANELAEIRLIRGLLPLAVSDLGRPIAERVYCGDSNLHACTVHITRTSPRGAWAAAIYRERWRFRELGDEREDDCGAGALPDETLELETGGETFSAWAAREVEQELGRLREPRVAVIPSESQLDEVVE